VQEKYLGTLFVIKSDSKRYGALTATLQNDFISRHDCYPNMLNVAYTMLVNYVNPPQEQTFDIQDGGLLRKRGGQPDGTKLWKRLLVWGLHTQRRAQPSWAWTVS
jgi:hypothetical protein